MPIAQSSSFKAQMNKQTYRQMQLEAYVSVGENTSMTLNARTNGKYNFVIRIWSNNQNNLLYIHNNVMSITNSVH